MFHAIGIARGTLAGSRKFTGVLIKWYSEVELKREKDLGRQTDIILLLHYWYHTGKPIAKLIFVDYFSFSKCISRVKTLSVDRKIQVF